MSPQLYGEISEISIAGHENDDIGLHLDGKLDRVDRHHHVYVRLVMSFFGGRSILGHDHETVGAQPMDELVFLVSLLLPGGNGRRQSRINHHLDQITSAIWACEKIPEL